MKPTGNSQINTRVYWNYIYTTPAKEKDYWAHTGRYTSMLEEVKDGDKFLDIGCGVGIPGRMVKEQRKGCEIWGTDISDEIINKNNAENLGIKYFQGYAGYNDFLPSDYFDTVFSGELMEHLDDPNVLFAEAYRVLKEGGKFVVSTPQDDAVTSPEHVWEFTKDDVRDYYVKNKFKDVRFKDLHNLEHLVIILGVGIK